MYTVIFLRAIRDFSYHHSKNERPQRRMSLHSAIAAENEALASANGFAGMHNVDDDLDEKQLVDVYFAIITEFRLKTHINIIKHYIKERHPTWVDGDAEQPEQIDDKNVLEAIKMLKRYELRLAAQENGAPMERNIDDWTAIYDILSSKNCFAESIYDLKGVSLVMNNVAKIDNLPEKHTKEALSLIQHSWCLVDAYHSSATFHKWVAKICYFLMLLFSISVVAVGLVTTNASPIKVDKYLGNYIIIGLSLTNALIAGLTSFMNPATRWHHLRSSALEIESHIWQFRTRSGKYRETRSGTSRNAEKTLHETLKECEQHTLQSGDLRHTTFYSNPKSKWNRHGQFRDNRYTSFYQKLKPGKTNPEEIDNHHSPLRPDEYLKFRLHPVLNFYRHRLPGYSMSRALTKILTILGSIGSSVLAVIDISVFSVLLVVIVSSVIAWAEFSGTDKKLERYSTVINGLTQIDLWWHSLPEVERLATKSIDKLVEEVETHVRSERQGWRATSQSAKMLQQAANDGGKGLARSDSMQSVASNSSPPSSPRR